MDIVYMLLVGAVIGWLAGQIMKGGGYGLLGNIVIGIVGSALGKFVFVDMLGMGGTSEITGLLISLGGAVLLILILGKLKKA